MRRPTDRAVSRGPTRRATCRSVLLAVPALSLLPATVGAHPVATPAEPATTVVQRAAVCIETRWATWVNDHGGDGLNDAQPYESTVGCSGFLVNPSGDIVTTGHCVDDGLDCLARWDTILFGVDESVVNEWVDCGWATSDDGTYLLRLELDGDISEERSIDLHGGTGGEETPR